MRRAIHDDVPLVAAAVRGLLLELGGAPPSTSAMGDAARALIDDPQAGALLVAQADRTTADPQDDSASDADEDRALVGVLGASWQTAIHIPGRYALIQDLWVHPAWRGRGVGGGLLQALSALTREREIARTEVGLPPARFAGLPATEAFYRANGFAPLGTRMRRVLP